MLQAGRVRLSWERAVAAENPILEKISGEVEAIKNGASCGERLVCEDRERHARRQVVEDAGHAAVRPGVCEQAAVVDRQKPLERFARLHGPLSREGPRHEDRCAVADHAPDHVFGQRRRAK